MKSAGVLLCGYLEIWQLETIHKLWMLSIFVLWLRDKMGAIYVTSYHSAHEEGTSNPLNQSSAREQITIYTKRSLQHWSPRLGELSQNDRSSKCYGCVDCYCLSKHAQVNLMAYTNLLFKKYFKLRHVVPQSDIPHSSCGKGWVFAYGSQAQVFQHVNWIQ